MLMRNAYVPWIVMLVLVISANTVFVRPAQASDTAKILAGIAVGALVYTALDNASDRCSDSRFYHRYEGDVNRRYDPPRRYDYSYEKPRQAYDRGYDNGFKDGRDYGRREGYNRGYDYGYSDGRYDERNRYCVGRPYERHRR